MRLVPTSARVLALVLCFGSLSIAFVGDVTSGAVPAFGVAPEGAPFVAPSTSERAAAADDRPAAPSAKAERARLARAASEVRAKRIAAAKRARAHRVALAKRAARERAARAHWARLPATKKLGFRWPAQGWITSGMGPRRGGFHHGTDIACRKGSFIRASKHGRVIFTKNLTIYGKTVVIRHPRGYSTLYAHMQRVYVRPGQVVGTHRIIGRCGSTGNSTGPHLHFELRRNGRFLKPGHYLL